MFIWLGRNPREAAASVPRSRDGAEVICSEPCNPSHRASAAPFAVLQAQLDKWPKGHVAKRKKG